MLTQRTSNCAREITGVNVDDLNCQIESIMEENDWPEFLEQIPRKKYAAGSVLARVYEREGDIPRVEFKNTRNLKQPQEPLPVGELTSDEVRNQAEFGILFGGNVAAVNEDGERFYTPDYRMPLWYYFNEDGADLAVESTDIVSQKFGDGPRGVNPWYRALSKSVAAKELGAGGVDFMLTLMHHAVTEKLAPGVTQKDAFDYVEQLRKQSQSGEHEGKGVAKKSKYGATQVKSNVDINRNTANMGAEEVILMVEACKLTLGSQIDAPDVVVLGRSDMGARATSDNALRPWFARGRREQRRTGKFAVDVLWIALRMMNGWSEEQLAQIRQNYTITCEGFVDPARDTRLDFEMARDLFDRQVIGKRDFAESAGRTYDASSLCEEEELECVARNVTPEGDLDANANAAQPTSNSR